MNWDKDIQNSLDAHLSGLHVSERQQAQMFNRIVRGEQPIMKKKISAALVFAIVMMIAMGSMALAAGLGLFGHFRQTQENNNGARLEKLETLADTYETTKAVAMPTPAVPVTGDTMYDKLLLDGTLYSDLKQTEQRYWEQVEQTITKLLVSNPAPDKNNDPLGWTAHMNSLQAQAAELAMPIVTSL